MGHNSKLCPYCLICFRIPGFAATKSVTARAETAKPAEIKAKKKKNSLFLCGIKHPGTLSGESHTSIQTTSSCVSIQSGAAPAPGGKQPSEASKQGVRRLTQGSVCNWEVLVSDSAVINHAGPILFSDSSVQGLTFNTHDPGPGCARDHRLQKHQN